jgi:hypothetical protein
MDDSETQSPYELACSLREYNEQLEQARRCMMRRNAASRQGSGRRFRQPYALLLCAADAPRCAWQVRELLAAEPGNEEYTDLQTSLLEARRFFCAAAQRSVRKRSRLHILTPHALAGRSSR